MAVINNLLYDVQEYKDGLNKAKNDLADYLRPIIAAMSDIDIYRISIPDASWNGNKLIVSIGESCRGYYSEEYFEIPASILYAANPNEAASEYKVEKIKKLADAYQKSVKEKIQKLQEELVENIYGDPTE